MTSPAISLGPDASARAAVLTGLLSRLSAEQRRVVLAPPGPLLVLAGAGSGKTLTLAARIAYAIATGRVAPEHVLAITFTTRAARELRERIARLAGAQLAARMECGTHHAVCSRLLRRHAALIGRTPRFSIYEPADVAQVLRRVLKRLDERGLAVDAVMRAITEAKSELCDASAVRASGPDGARIARAWDALEVELARSDALDFDDLLVRSVALLRDRPEIRAEATKRWRFVLVDEFQDTNRPQWAWLELVCGHGNLTVLGDDDQAVYRFRGAAVENILRLPQRLPGCRVRRLERNYRSTPAIVAAANRLIAHNPERHPKRMWATGDVGRPVSVRSFLDADREAEAVAAWCAARLRAGTTPDQVGVLFRMRRLADPLSATLTAAGLAHRVLGDRALLERAEIRDALAHLQLLANPRDRQALVRAAATLPGVGPRAVERVLNHADRGTGGDLLRAARQADAIDGLTTAARATLPAWATAMRSVGDDPDVPLPQVVGRGLVASGLPARLARSLDPTASARLERLRSLVAMARTHAARDPDATLVDFLGGLALAAEPEQDAAERITLATIHAAKGLEWDAVWVCGWEEDTLPAALALADGEVAEERRLAYVAITRAGREFAASRVWRRGERRGLPPSRFLAELRPG
jgi:DNA helicase-2/ATP-dependent DNA helicase PcrA